MRGFNRVLKIIAVLILVISVTKTYAKTEFAPAKDYPVGINPKAVVIADFNGDGKPDIAVANSGDPEIGDPGNVSILLNNGDGTFQPTRNITAGKNPCSIAVGDFNRDGHLDLVVVNNAINVAGGWLPGTVSVLLGNGDGTFQTHVDYAAGTGPCSVAEGDFNGDNRLDLAVAAHPANVVSVLLGKGDGTFEPRVDYAAGNAGGNGAMAVAVADFNRDGKADLAVAGSFSAGTVGILQGNGDGTFQLPTGYDPAGMFGQSLAVGDFNGDGKLKLAVTYANFGNATASGVSVLPGNGDGSFSQGSNLATGSAGCHAGSPLLTDFDGDGRLDLAVIVGGGPHDGVCLFLGAGTILFFKDNGKGMLQESFTISTDSGSGQDLGAAADLDGNGLPDLVILNRDNTIGVLINSTPPDFSLSPEATSLTLKRGSQLSEVISTSAQGGSSEVIALTCSIAGPAPMPTCGISPASVKPGESATLTIDAGALAAGVRTPRGFSAAGTLLGPWLPLGMFGCVLAAAADQKRRRLWVLCLPILVATILSAACGGSSSSVKRPSAQNYAVTVTGTSGAIQHSTAISVTVQ